MLLFRAAANEIPKQLNRNPANLKKATLDMFLSSSVVRDEANIERSTAGVTGMPPFSPLGPDGSGNGLDIVERGRGVLAVAAEDEEEVLCLPLPAVTVEEVEDMMFWWRLNRGIHHFLPF